MKLDPVRGAKLGAGSAILFPIVTSINQYLRNEKVVISSLVAGALFVFFVFGIIGTLTDKIGSDIGD